MAIKIKSVTRIVIKPNVGMVIYHEGEYDRKGTPYKMNLTLGAEPMEEFAKAIRSVAGALIKSGPMGGFKHALESDQLAEHIATADLQPVLKMTLSRVNKMVQVRDIRLKWDEGELVSVKIKGSFTNHQGDTVPVESPAIQMDQATYGWEGSLRKQVESLIEKAQEYLDGQYTKVVVEEVKEEAEEEEEAVDEGVVKEKSGQLKISVPPRMKAA